jgi:triosephosphate isomerase (TIM)
MSMARARRPLFCGNWKLNGSIAESLALASDVRNGVSTVRDADVSVAPSFTALYAVAKRLEDGPVGVAAQDCFWDEKGAFTGEVAPSQLVDVGCKQVIVGHSERRQLFGELDAAVNLKARAALGAGLVPIICIGETLAERDAGETLGRVQAQLDAALAEMSGDELARVVIAYEPVWAIGSGKTPTEAEVGVMHAFIREELLRQFPDAGAGVRILYGGSVKAANAATLLAIPEVGGALVGGASLKAEDFLGIARGAIARGP